MTANRVLFCATVDTHLQAFHLPALAWFKRQGWEVHAAANGSADLPHVDRRFVLPFGRSPLQRGNLEAYRQLRAIVEEHAYRLVHCHTPVGGALARLAARSARRRGTAVFYTAHGFHFCRGAPLASWLLYYPAEKVLSRLTDTLITINEEDYRLAVARRFRAGRIVRVHGVGVDTGRFRPMSRLEKMRQRELFHYGMDDFLLFYAAEFNRNKNHRLLIEAMSLLKTRLPGARLLLAGDGPLLRQCREQAALAGVGGSIDFLGYRTDIDRLLPMCDAAISSSLREGLPVNILEAMACGLPVAATRNRGHAELVAEGRNGFLTPPDSAEELAERIVRLGLSAELRERMGFESIQAVKDYSQARVGEELAELYAAYRNGDEYGAERQYRAADL